MSTAETLAAVERVAAYVEWHTMLGSNQPPVIASYPGNLYEPAVELTVADLRELLTAALDREPRTGRARAADPATSHTAGRNVAVRAGSQRAKLLAAYRWVDREAKFGARAHADLTDSEAQAQSGVPVRSCWWKRCSELRADGLIAYTGETRADALSGEQRALSRITDLGRRQLALMGREQT